MLRSLAARAGWDPGQIDLRLLQGPVEPELPPTPDGLVGPDLLGAVHEALLDPCSRRAAGAHYTPAPLASSLVAWALAGWSSRPPGALRVVDLAVGGGAFLLAVARLQRAEGRPVEEVLAGLAGVDLDPGAVAVAEATLVAWGRGEGWDGTGPGPLLVVGDGTDPECFGRDGTEPTAVGSPGPGRGQVDLVVGNPPFRSQLGRATARDRATAARLRDHYGPEVGGYVDDAAVFLRAACDWPRPGGRVVLVQPESVLGARDAEGVRAAIAARAELVGLWVAGEHAFAAGIDVCAPVLEAHGAPGRTVPTTDRWVARSDGTEVRPGRAEPRPTGRSWAPLLARSRAVPIVDLSDRAGTLGDLATATAGFRQHFYAVAPHVREAPEGVDTVDTSLDPVLTARLVDPLTLRWGRRPARIAGHVWERPAVDLTAVASDAPDVAAWLQDRLRPKVVVAPQTRVVEAAIDPTGRFLPGVPLVSVEPRSGPDRGADPHGSSEADLTLWLIVAALSAPPITAWALAQVAGTARHREALRLPARQILTVPLPPDRDAWEAAARALRDGHPLDEVGPGLTTAYGLGADHPVTAWWRARLPAMSGRVGT